MFNSKLKSEIAALKAEIASEPHEAEVSHRPLSPKSASTRNKVLLLSRRKQRP